MLEELGRLAPVYAVQGNNDAPLGGLGLPLRYDVALEGVDVHIVHELPDAQPFAYTRVVVFGHSHRQLAEWRGDILYLNPGAAGRVGFHKLQTCALLRIEGTRITARRSSWERARSCHVRSCPSPACRSCRRARNPRLRGIA